MRNTTHHQVLLLQVLSKRHAELEWRAGRVWLRDCGSSNGTFLNLARLSRAGEGSQARPVRWAPGLYTLL